MKFKLSIAVVLALIIFCISGTALALPPLERQVLIQQIQQQIAQLQSQLQEMLAEQQGNTSWCHAFNIDLDQGDTGFEVASLQTALQKQGFIISASEVQNLQFGTTTGQAVKDFKQKYSSQITTAGTTKVGEITRGMLNQLYGCTTNTVCTQDAKQCPDSSYVSRVPPNCDFAACPISISACQEGNWTYTLSPSTCPSSGIQTKTWSKIGTCLGGVTHPSTETVTCSYQVNTCTSFTYSSWSTCNQSGTQTRTVTSSSPSGCTGGNPTTSTTCTYIPIIPICANSNWTYTLSPIACPSSGTQTKTWTSIGTCSGGVSHPSTETVICNYQTPTCTSFTYSNWSLCTQSGIQTRTVTSSYPSGCTGGNPITSQSCSYTPSCAENNWTYSLYPTDCPPWSGVQTKTWSKVGTCAGGVSHPSTETVICNYQTPTCTSFTYSDWSSCSQSGIQTRTVTSSYPSGCTGGNPITSQSWYCTYISSVCTPNWQCDLWSTCANNQKTRTCTDSNSCGVTIGKPSTTQLCCTPSWDCTPWTNCTNFQQTRTCSDLNYCGVFSGKPAETQSCVYQSCSDSGPYIGDFDCKDQSGGYYNDCLYNRVSKKYKCENDRCTAKNYKCIDGQICLYGECPGAEKEEYCYDSDGGNFMVKGTCRDTFTDAFGGTPFTDSCQNYSVVREWYCGIQADRGLTCLAQDVSCPYGCSDGKCSDVVK